MHRFAPSAHIGIAFTLLLACVAPSMLHAERTARAVFADLILADSAAQPALVEQLSEYGDQDIALIYEGWRTGNVYGPEPATPGELVLQTDDGTWAFILTGEPLEMSAAEIEALDKKRPSRGIRKSMQSLLDTLGLRAENPDTRLDSATKMGISQDPEYLDALRARLEAEPVARVSQAIREAIAISLLKNGTDAERIESVKLLGDAHSIAARDYIQGHLNAEIEAGREDSELAVASLAAINKIESYIKRIEFFGSFFRGLSTGSVLLIVAFGLAITFGLMGIINMAHGEFVAIGGYTTFMVQNLFINVWGLESNTFGWYFLFSLPASFIVAAIVGLFLEKTVIRFLYRRPLESLLCTWGLSMVMQQTFRLIFGAANVQVNTPQWLLGSFTLGGLNMSYTRLFILLIALIVIILTWLLLRKTNLGLHIRAVMQNRDMASGLGIPVSRVNSMTFALGCGLAAVGGCVLSQIGNVGPSMGQAYIVDCFMVVVIGSVGNLLGAGVSAMGIGMVDQLLQPSLGPVMGKITVFAAIILFLQWRPGGIFPTRSRSLED